MEDNVETSSGNISVKEEDGHVVFEKDCEDDLEELFYNHEYFAMIGYPDAIIEKLDKSTRQPVAIKGGKGPIRMPYRSFLRTFGLNTDVNKSTHDGDDISLNEEEDEDKSDNLFTRFFGKKSPTEIETPMEVKKDEFSLRDSNRVSTATGVFGENHPNGSQGSQMSEIVAHNAPLQTPDAKCVSVSESHKKDCIWRCKWEEREEEEFEQRLREYRAEKKSGIIVEGRRIGKIKMCERIKKGESKLEIMKGLLEGTKEEKYEKMKKRMSNMNTSIG